MNKTQRYNLLVTRAKALGIIGTMSAVMHAAPSEVREEVSLALHGQDHGGLAQDSNALPVSVEMVKAIERVKARCDSDRDCILSKAERNQLLRDMHRRSI